VGSVDVDPDRIEVHLVLAAEDRDRQTAFQQVATRSQGLAQLLDSLQIPKSRRHTSGIELHEITHPERKSVSYLARAGIWVRLDPDGPLSILLTRAVKEVGSSVGGLSWYLSRTNPARLEAVRRAALDSRDRARAAAEALGLEVAGVVEIRLLGGTGPRRVVMAGARHRAMTRLTEPDIEVGQISADAEVEVTFHVQPMVGANLPADSDPDS
jgi:hypothetical protein